MDSDMDLLFLSNPTAAASLSTKRPRTERQRTGHGSRCTARDGLIGSCAFGPLTDQALGDDASRLTTITRGALNFGFEYDAANRRTKMTYPNGVNTAYQYDNLNRLTNLAATHTASGTQVTNFGYQYDAAGSRTQKSTLDFTEDYKYDPLYRLTRADRTNPGVTPPNQWTWNYDQVGNRTSAQKDSEATTSDYNEKNQLTGSTGGGKMLWRGILDEPGNVNLTNAAASINGQPARMLAGNVFEAELNLPTGANTVTIQAQDGSGNVATKNYSINVTGAPATYTYDANGNLATKVEGGDTWAYSFNALNQMTAVTKNAVTQATYSYDPLGRRLTKLASGIATKWLYDGEDIAQQTVGATIALFVHGPGIDEPLSQSTTVATEYLHADGLSSITRHTTLTGAVAQTITYDVWGNIQSGAPAPYGFTGREGDASAQMHYYRARWYDSSIGRFLSEDPVSSIARPSLYPYVMDNPAGFVDPSGKIPDAVVLYPFACQIAMGTYASAADPDKSDWKNGNEGNRSVHCWLACQTNRFCYLLMVPQAPEAAQEGYESYRGSTGDYEDDNTAARWGIYYSYRLTRSCKTICDQNWRRPCGS